MPEEPMKMSGSVWIAAAVLAAAGIATFLGFKISRERLGEELLAAILEVFVGVFAVSVLLERHRRQSEARVRKEELIRELYDVWRQCDTARVLISTHRSVKTWRDQFILLNRLDEPLSNIKEGVRKLGEEGETKRAEEMLRTIDDVRDFLRSIRKEYKTSYSAATMKQEEYEIMKHKGLAPSLDAHWHEVLADLRFTKRFVEEEGVVDALKEAAAVLRREVLGLA